MNLEEQVEIAGVKIALAPDLDPAVRAAMVSGSYEEPELRALAATLQADDVVMELGTGIGLLSAYCAMHIGSERVHSFEANPELEPRIRRTWALNGVAPQLQMCMLGEHAGEQDFYVHDAFWASSAEPVEGTTRVVRVPVRPLNEQIRRIDPSVLVMDIEGGEHVLLQFIDLHHVTRVVAEIHERMLGREKVDGMMRRLYGWGFFIDRDLSTWEVCCLDRRPEMPAARRVSLEEFLDGPWRLAGHWAQPYFDELSALLPPGSRYAMVDDDPWGSLQVLPRRTRLPFIERNSRYWGAPVDDAQALHELERLRAQGLQALVFQPSACWWLEHYPGFAQRLRQTGRPLGDGTHFTAFSL